MKFKIHYTINELDDAFIVEGDTISDIQENTEIEMVKRGLDAEKNDCWSEEIT